MSRSNALMFALLGACVLTVACDEKPAPAPAPAKAPAKAEPVCSWTAPAAGNTVTWKAFKFTEKTGVGGGFDTVKVAGAKAAPEPWKALNGLTFEIDTASVNSKNPERDAKLVASFFGALTETAAIKGTVKATSADAATLTITMNGASHDVPVKLAKGEGDALTMSGTLNMDTWGGGPAIAALNKVCDDLHKGADGVSKLWPEVEIGATVALQKTCK